VTGEVTPDNRWVEVPGIPEDGVEGADELSGDPARLIATLDHSMKSASVDVGWIIIAP
jgi:hypothetical protein